MTAKYFIVHVSCTVQGRKFRPGVCYEIKKGFTQAAEDMAEKGMATLFEDEVRIVSGVPHRIQEQGQDKRAVSAPSPSSPGTGNVPGPAPVLIPGNFPDKFGRTAVRRKKKDFN